MKRDNRYMNFIDGEWVESGSGDYYDVYNPAASDELVGKFPLSTEKDVDRAVKSADKAFEVWSNTTITERSKLMYTFIELCEENVDYLAESLSLEQGKPLKEALGETKRGIEEVYYVTGEAARLEGLTLPSTRPNVKNSVLRVPIGPVAAITPWNFPVITPLRKIVPALIAGCTVVFKPASSTPLTATLIVDLLDKAGFPAGVVNLIVGKGSKVGNALVSNPKIKGISFTGSTKVGEHINVAAARNFTRVQLEMGGKNPAVVAEYSDLENAASEIVSAAFSNAGQRCTAISRVVVLEKHRAELEDLIIGKVKDFKVGKGMDEGTDIGPIIDQAALESIAGYVDSAREAGANVRIGGNILSGGIYDKGAYYEPTVITDVTPDMKVAKEEIFGPVLVIISVKGFDEAIAVSNNTQYGLAAAVFSDRLDFINEFINREQTGMINVNHGTASEMHMPFGGTKNSGYGPFSIGTTNKYFFTEPRVVYTKYK
ncbi:MAG: aldehyde dehydrogenase family protein [Halanaerobiales bacterium]